MDDLLLENLSPATIHQIAWDIRDGTANPEDARRLMMLFCSCVDSNTQPPMELFRHFRDAFQSILDKQKTPERALGLTRKKSRPKSNPAIRADMAHELLRLRLAGESHQNALHVVANKFGWGETIVGEAWTQHKQDAIVIERLTRALDKYPWTDDEVARLTEIFNKESWFIAPGKSATKAA